jgi:hypothetical protein
MEVPQDVSDGDMASRRDSGNQVGCECHAAIRDLAILNIALEEP